MGITEKINHSDFYQVKLYKEGVFWIAYEQSAYAVSQIKDLKPTKKFVKIAKSEIASVGFPDSVLQQVLPHFEIKERNGTEIILSVYDEINLVSFCKWKSDIPVFSVVNRTDDKSIDTAKQSIVITEDLAINTEEKEILKEIKMFAIANVTPMECMLFLSQIQKKLSAS